MENSFVNLFRILMGIVVGGICGLLVGFSISLTLYWTAFLLTYGQGELSTAVLILAFLFILSPTLILSLVGAVLGAKIMKRKPV